MTMVAVDSFPATATNQLIMMHPLLQTAPDVTSSSCCSAPMAEATVLHHHHHLHRPALNYMYYIPAAAAGADQSAAGLSWGLATAPNNNIVAAWETMDSHTMRINTTQYDDVEDAATCNMTNSYLVLDGHDDDDNYGRDDNDIDRDDPHKGPHNHQTESHMKQSVMSTPAGHLNSLDLASSSSCSSNPLSNWITSIPGAPQPSLMHQIYTGAINMPHHETSFTKLMLGGLAEEGDQGQMIQQDEAGRDLITSFNFGLATPPISDKRIGRSYSSSSSGDHQFINESISMESVNGNSPKKEISSAPPASSLSIDHQMSMPQMISNHSVQCYVGPMWLPGGASYYMHNTAPINLDRQQQAGRPDDDTPIMSRLQPMSSNAISNMVLAGSSTIASSHHDFTNWSSCSRDQFAISDQLQQPGTSRATSFVSNMQFAMNGSAAILSSGQPEHVISTNSTSKFSVANKKKVEHQINVDEEEEDDVRSSGGCPTTAEDVQYQSLTTAAGTKRQRQAIADHRDPALLSAPPLKQRCVQTSKPKPAQEGVPSSSESPELQQPATTNHTSAGSSACTPAPDALVGPALNTTGRPRTRRGSATDPQSVYARHRRERINERLKILQNLVPNGAKVDIVTMLEEAINYVKFLQLQVKLLSSDEYWMYAPTSYNGIDVSFDMLQSTS